MVFSLIDNYEMIKNIISSVDEGIHIVDKDGITVFYNKVASEHDGLSIDEVVGKHLLEVYPSLTPDTSTLLKVIKTKKPIYHLPQTYKNNRGILIDTINTTLPITIGDQFVGAVEIAKDYSKVKLLYNKLAELRSHNKKSNPSEVTGAKYTFNDLITKSKAFIEIKNIAKAAANSRSPILVYGETGTGKELLVQSIHNQSTRKYEPFIAQNCSAIPETLLESILFGTAKGSFTGANDRPGLFELAHGGTLFLDELNSMPLHLQTRLLRILEDGIVRRVGGSKAYEIDVRVIVAMNQPPADLMREKQLRADLYYRLNVFLLEIPPLRTRKEDIAVLTYHFLRHFNVFFKKNVLMIEENVIKLLFEYEWPGNVRELKHALEYAINLADGTMLTTEHLPPFLDKAKKTDVEMKPLRKILEETEKNYILAALSNSNGNVLKAAKLLQIPRQTLQYKMTKLQIIQRNS